MDKKQLLKLLDKFFEENGYYDNEYGHDCCVIDGTGYNLDSLADDIIKLNK